MTPDDTRLVELAVEARSLIASASYSLRRGNFAQKMWLLDADTLALAIAAAAIRAHTTQGTK